MRLRKADFRQRINGNHRIEFSSEAITSYSGLELLSRYFRQIRLSDRIRKAFAGHLFFGDYGVVECIRTLVALLFTGGRKLEHVRYIASDPLVKRFCGLFCLSSDRTISRFLKQFRNNSIRRLIDFNTEIVSEKLKDQNLSRITLDLDGTVLSCGNQVAFAYRGYNPHQRYAKSYFPLLCHVAQTGHFLRIQNRPGNVHDSKGALRILQQAVASIREGMGFTGIVETRLDSAFFNRDILQYLSLHRIEFALKVPMWSRLRLKEIIQSRKRWEPAGDRLWAFSKAIRIEKWNRDVDLTFYRHKLSDHPPKNYQYDLFSPDDGVYEYFVLVTNKKVSPKTLYDFYNGRCAMEKQIAELKGEFAFDTVPTNHYGANSAFQQICVLAYNLIRNFQIDTGLAVDRTPSIKRTGLFSFVSLKTIRFKMISVAGRILSGNVLRLNENPAVKTLYTKIESELPYRQAA